MENYKLMKGMSRLLLGILSCMVPAALPAAVLPIDFEPPTYITGNVIGQDGWNGLASFGTDYNIVSIDPIAGTQSLQLTGGSTSLHAARSGNFASQPATLSWLMRIDSSSGGQFEAGLANAGFSTPFLIVFAASGQLQYYGKVAPSDPTTFINLGGTYSQGVVYSVNLLGIDYNAGTYSVNIIDTTSSLSVASGNNLNMAFAPGDSAMSFDFLLRNATAGSSGMVDNVSLNAVPEPSVLTLLSGGGLLALAGFIRRQRKPSH